MSIGPPLTFREAKLSPWWPQYKGAMDVEYGGLTENRTYDVVKRISMPRGTNLIRGKWIFSDKRGEDGKVIKFKARWLACGYSQVLGVDFKETFAGVVVAKSFRIMLVILNEDAQNEMEHWDVKMAFTVAPLEETLYMVEPEGYERVPKGENVCLLKRSLYGLKQSARTWQLLLETYFLQNGFSRSKADACFFFRVIFSKGEKSFCLVSTHVDDIFVLFNKTGKIFRDELFKKILTDIKIENLGPISWALKTLILRDRLSGKIKISQELFTREFLAKEAELPRLFPGIKSPATNPNFPENFLPCDRLDKIDESLKGNFQKDIGSFWWLAQISRPDIFYATHRCAKLVNSPCPRLGQRIQKIKDYLSLTPTLGVVFSRHLDAPPPYPAMSMRISLLRILTPLG